MVSVAQALHHFLNADTHAFQGMKYIRAFIAKDSEYVDKQLSKFGYDETDTEQKKEITRLYNKARRQWLDSRSTMTHKTDVLCDCQLCILEKLRDFAYDGIEVKNKKT